MRLTVLQIFTKLWISFGTVRTFVRFDALMSIHMLLERLLPHERLPATLLLTQKPPLSPMRHLVPAKVTCAKKEKTQGWGFFPKLPLDSTTNTDFFGWMWTNNNGKHDPWISLAPVPIDGNCSRGNGAEFSSWMTCHIRSRGRDEHLNELPCGFSARSSVGMIGHIRGNYITSS